MSGAGGGAGGGASNAGRKMTPKGQMSSSNSGPAIMMMPPNIRATFMPDPPVKHLPPPSTQRRRTKVYMDLPDLYEDEDAEDGEEKEAQSWPTCKVGITGMSSYLQHFGSLTSTMKVTDSSLHHPLKKIKLAKQVLYEQQVLEPLRQEYRLHQKECAGEYVGMNCYKTLFVGRLAYEVTERKLLREMEAFGPIKDIRLIFPKEGVSETEPSIKNAVTTKKSRGYAFIEYEHEEDMKRAYRAADGMKIEGREIVVDVERGHTVPHWFPRRLGGGLGGTRLGGREVNVTYPGRFDPTKQSPPPGSFPSNLGPPAGNRMMMPPPPTSGPYRGPPPPRDDRDRGPGPGYYPSSRPPPPYDDRRGGGGPPPRRFDDRGGGGGGYGGPPGPGRQDDRFMKRGRSRSPSPPRSRDSRRGRF